GLEARVAVGAAVPEERKLALRRAADARLLAAVEACAQAVVLVHLPARGDAVVDRVLELDVIGVTEERVAEIGEERELVEGAISVRLQPEVGRAGAEALAGIRGRQLHAASEVKSALEVVVVPEVVGRGADHVT